MKESRPEDSFCSEAYPLFSTDSAIFLSGLLSLFFVTKLGSERGLPLQYLYIGTAVPVALLILRQALDFSYKEELVTNSLADYILQARSRRENPPTARKYEPQQTAQKTDP